MVRALTGMPVVSRPLRGLSTIFHAPRSVSIRRSCGTTHSYPSARRGTVARRESHTHGDGHRRHRASGGNRTLLHNDTRKTRSTRSGRHSWLKSALVSGLILLSGVSASHLFSEYTRVQRVIITNDDGQRAEATEARDHLKAVQILPLLRLLRAGPLSDSEPEQRWILRRLEGLLMESAAARDQFVGQDGIRQLVQMALSQDTAYSIRAEIVHLFNGLCTLDAGASTAEAILSAGGLEFFGSVLLTYHDCHPALMNSETLSRLLSLRSPPPRLPVGEQQWDEAVLLDANTCLAPLLLALPVDSTDIMAKQSVAHVHAVSDAWAAANTTPAGDAAGSSAPVFDVDDFLDLMRDQTSHGAQPEIQNDAALLSVKALASLATAGDNSETVVANGGVALLRRIVDQHKSELQIKIETARTLANICKSRLAAESIIAEGFVPLLTEWVSQDSAKSPDEFLDALQCQAARVLANIGAVTCGLTDGSEGHMGINRMTHGPSFYDESVLLLYPLLRSVEEDRNVPSGFGGDILSYARRKLKAATSAPGSHSDTVSSTGGDAFDVDIVLVHGLLGNALSTWRVAHPHERADLLADTDIRKIELPPDTSVSSFPSLVAQMEQQRSKAEQADQQVYQTARRRWGFQLPSAKDLAEHELVDANDVSWSKFVCWPKEWLPFDLSAGSGNNIRVLSLQYSSFLSAWNGKQITIADRAEIALRALRDAQVGVRVNPRREKKVVFIAHSMGGLLVKHVLANDAESESHVISDSTAAIVFMSTPHFGSMLPDLAEYIPRVVYNPSQEVLELRRDNAQLRTLNGTLGTLPHVSILSFGEKQKTPLKLVGEIVSTTIVPLDSCNPQVGEFVPVERTHFNICKPRSRSDVVYRHLVDFISRALGSNTTDS